MTDTSEFASYNVSTIKVPYQIPEDANGLMFVAEAPGKDEEEQRIPLVGVSGKSFNGWLKIAGIKRSDCIIGNVFRFRPENNKVDNFFCSDRIAKAQDIPISTARFGKCRGKNLISVFEPEINYLISRIVKYKPTVIVTMGGISTWALLGLDKITSVQGKKFQETFEYKSNKHMCTIYPTYHPSSALAYRSPSGEREQAIIKTFKTAKKEVKKKG